MPNLLASILSVTSGTAPATYANVPDLSAVVSIASTNSIILLIATVPIVLSAQDSADFQFAHDGVREGPEMTLVYSDNVDEGVHGTMVYALTGISGSHTLSVQWQDRIGAPPLDTGRSRGFTIVELLDGEANLLINVSSTSAGTAPVSYADIPSFTGTPTVASTDSILLFIANVMLDKTDNFQKTADMQFAVGGVREGPELTWCWDDSTADGASIGAGCMTHVKTGLSGAQTLSCQWQIRTSSPALDTGRTRTFQVLELLSADLLVNIVTTAAGAAAPATYADVPALSGTGSVDSTGSVVLMGGNVPIDDDAADMTADFQFADDGTREGPEMTSIFNDGLNDQSCSGMLWAKDGISGSHTFSLQWQDRMGTPGLDTVRNRSFYVIDLKPSITTTTVDINKGAEYRITFKDQDLQKGGDYNILLADVEVVKAAQYALINADQDILLSAVYRILLADNDITKSGAYTVLVQVDIQKSGQYTVIIVDNDLTKAAEYRIIMEDQDITKSAQYKVKPTFDIQKLATYAVGQVKDIVKTGQYTILMADQDITKAGEYRLIFANQDVVKSGQYTVLTVVDIIKAAQYAVISVDQDIQKSALYKLKPTFDIQKLGQYGIIIVDNDVVINGDYNVVITTNLGIIGRYVMVGEAVADLDIQLPLDEQARQPGDVEILERTLSLEE